ncbi:MAG: hypothetical protein COY36_02415 [Zetaproteobacteria bacterium CG_4_10_14_0_2_um_filter_55_20]|nr:MAG: hypothetical protein COT53_04695 [Zetaproteobacteria bacterium CG08_land_8_20_14_0_20_55_17]PIY51464.1 MAG: hypothetical protein COZ01_11065 [Zetaproteobacteria bacterium CG_4_10_14_0_8_um_filter_55_43]PIZ39609.1 MAG: hypothetical protein COY36_02415 [Zetaproteobacteria bacterium CG_4_10_14_0_2_um_filter_55_20]
MTLKPGVALRLQFLARVVRKECQHLSTTDSRLFGALFSQEEASMLDANPDLAERVEAFVGRFGRLQDTVGDKLLPLLLNILGEKTSAAIDNLDRAERLELLQSADEWMAMRNLRNQMVHEYVEDPIVLFSALQSGHTFVPVLIDTANRMIAEIERRGWL